MAINIKFVIGIDMHKENYVYKSTVYIIDCKADKKNCVSILVNTMGYNFYIFKSIEKFLQFYKDNMFGCILIISHNPNMNISTIPKYLLKHGCLLPVVAILSEINIQKIVTAVRQGVVDILIKPINKKILAHSINKSFVIAQENYKKHTEHRNTINNFNLLTNREKQIFSQIIEGCSNRIIASKLLISVRTVEMHRYHIMQKMHASTVVALIKQSILLSKIN